MEKTLKTILESSIKPTSEKLFNSFKLACELILSEKNIFIATPINANIPITYFEELRVEIAKQMKEGKSSESNKDYKKFIKYFDDNAILLYDDTYASASGNMNYIYRAKGIRVYLLKSGVAKAVTVNCTIDHEGFNLSLEEFDSFDLTSITKEDVIQLFQYMNCKNIKDSIVQIIQIISNIRKEFQYAYFLEYLLTPPDVDVISDFSNKIQIKLWNLCLSKRHESSIGKDNQNSFIKILTSLGISPTLKQYSSYIAQFSGNNEIMNAIKRIEKNTNDKPLKVRFTTPFFEFSPNALIKRINTSNNPKFWRIIFILAIIIILTVFSEVIYNLF